MAKHIQAVHEEKKPFQCEFCGYTAAHKYKLARHIKKIHEAKKPFKFGMQRKIDLKSNVTNIVVANPEFDEKHDASTTKSSACHICGSTFQTVQDIMNHISGNLHDFFLHTRVQNGWSGWLIEPSDENK